MIVSSNDEFSIKYIKFLLEKAEFIPYFCPGSAKLPTAYNRIKPKARSPPKRERLSGRG